MITFEMAYAVTCKGAAVLPVEGKEEKEEEEEEHRDARGEAHHLGLVWLPALPAVRPDGVGIEGTLSGDESSSDEGVDSVEGRGMEDGGCEEAGAHVIGGGGVGVAEVEEGQGQGGDGHSAPSVPGRPSWSRS